jgi:branched-chain amino acid transport system ATP-binding protein
MKTGLDVRNLYKNFGGLVVARDISLDLKPGARKALIGPNGAGKTTLANLITGALSASRGAIRLDGRDITHLKESARVRSGIAKTFQITTLFARMSVRQNIRLPILERLHRGLRWFGRADRDPRIEAEIDALLQQFQLQDVAGTAVQDLAYGQQRLVEMALTLALRPRILILDEPSAGVPTSDNHIITDAIERLPDDLAVLIIEHDMKLVFRVADSIVVMVNGEVLTEGTPQDISRDAQVRDLYLGARHNG